MEGLGRRWGASWEIGGDSGRVSEGHETIARAAFSNDSCREGSAACASYTRHGRVIFKGRAGRGGRGRAGWRGLGGSLGGPSLGGYRGCLGGVWGGVFYYTLLGNVWRLRGRPFWEGQGEGSWEGKNQRKSMAGALFLSLRVGAGKGVWSGRGARKACPGYSFVQILSPKDPAKKEARGGFQK